MLWFYNTVAVNDIFLGIFGHVTHSCFQAISSGISKAIWKHIDKLRQREYQIYAQIPCIHFSSDSKLSWHSQFKLYIVCSLPLLNAFCQNYRLFLNSLHILYSIKWKISPTPYMIKNLMSWIKWLNKLIFVFFCVYRNAQMLCEAATETVSLGFVLRYVAILWNLIRKY